MFNINSNIIKINEEKVMEYNKVIIDVLRRYKENNNNDNIEKAFFEIEELDNISSGNNLINLEKLFFDETLREMREEPFIKKVKLI